MHPQYSPRQQFVRVCECGCGQPTLIALKDDPRHGIVGGQPQHFVFNHHFRLLPVRKKPIEERFWSKVNKHSGHFWNGTECWDWQGSTDCKGYGYFYVPGKGMQKAHRFSYELANGPLPTGIYGCHHCDRPGCIRPEHIFGGTQFDNMRDMVSKGRKLTQGIHNSRAILSEGDVRSIYARIVAGERGADIAREYGLSQTAINRIKHGRSWKHLNLADPVAVARYTQCRLPVWF